MEEDGMGWDGMGQDRTMGITLHLSVPSPAGIHRV